MKYYSIYRFIAFLFLMLGLVDCAKAQKTTTRYTTVYEAEIKYDGVEYNRSEHKLIPTDIRVTFINGEYRIDFYNKNELELAATLYCEYDIKNDGVFIYTVIQSKINLGDKNPDPNEMRVSSRTSLSDIAGNKQGIEKWFLLWSGNEVYGYTLHD
jgi:hypothetical protein